MVDWGTVPDWVSGIGTTGALFATLYIVLSDRRAAEIQQARQIQLFRRHEFDAESGRVTGLGARGGFVVDLTWKGGKVTSLTVHSNGGTSTTVKAGSWTKKVVLERGCSVTLVPGRH